MEQGGVHDTIRYTQVYEQIDNNSSNEVYRSIDSFEDIMALERQHAAIDYIQDALQGSDLDDRTRALAPLISPRHAVDQVNNQFAHRILPAFMQPDYNEALRAFRALEPHTTDQEMLLLINDHEFETIYTGLHEHLTSSIGRMADMVRDRLSEGGQIQWNDRYQFKDTSKRSLERLETVGIVAKFNEESLPKLQEAYGASKMTNLPMIEFLKNERIVSVNGFADSKVSLIIHDAMDHTWGFQLLRDSGLYEKYRDMFTSIGDPMNTDIFKREGEIISSIGFGVRYGATQENGFQPLISHIDMRRMFDEYAQDGQLTDRHKGAHEILRAISSHSREGLSLGFTFSNYITELDEQRRKHGKIKTRDIETGEITGELNEFGPEFMSMFIELHHEILSSRNKHRDNLFRLHILLEEYLVSLARGERAMSDAFTVKVQDMGNIDYSKTPLESGKLRWMFKNYGFAATKEAMI